MGSKSECFINLLQESAVLLHKIEEEKLTNMVAKHLNSNICRSLILLGMKT